MGLNKKEFKIRTIANGLGDCFFVEIKNNGEECVILVDGNTGVSTELENTIRDYDKIDCIVVTHCDYDHIGGILALLKSNNEELLKKFRDTVVIYNNVTKEDGTIHYGHSRALTRRLRELNEKYDKFRVIPSYSTTQNERVIKDFLNIFYLDACLECKEQLKDLQKETPCLILLGPDKEGIKEVFKNYQNTYVRVSEDVKKTLDGIIDKIIEEEIDKRSAEDLEAAVDVKEAIWKAIDEKSEIKDEVSTEENREKINEIIDKKVGKATSAAVTINRNSIAFLLEFADKKVLFCGDGYMEIKNKQMIISRAKQILGEDNKIDLIKMAHHGAADNNRGLKDFSVKYKCHRFLVTGEVDWNKKKQHPDENLIRSLEETAKSPENLGGRLEIYTSVNIKEYYQENRIIFHDDNEIDIFELEA